MERKNVAIMEINKKIIDMIYNHQIFEQNFDIKILL